METLFLTQTVGQSIKEFYDRHDFGEDGGVNEKIAWIKFGFISLPMPNFDSRRNNVYLHDVSHIVTGCDTTWKGESAASAWEVASGGWGKLYIPWLLTLWAMGLGVVFYTKSTLAAFNKGLTMNNAFTSNLTKEQMFRLTVAELIEVLQRKTNRNESAVKWVLISLFVFISPMIAGLSLLLTLINLF